MAIATFLLAELREEAGDAGAFAGLMEQVLERAERVRSAHATEVAAAANLNFGRVAAERGDLEEGIRRPRPPIAGLGDPDDQLARAVLADPDDNRPRLAWLRR